MDGRKPTMPFRAAGMREDPPVSVPSPARTTPAAIATAVPPLLPPAKQLGSNALRTGPKAALLLVMPYANSCMFALPTICAPAKRSRATAGASTLGTYVRSAGVPQVQGMPATSMLSLIASEYPASGRAGPGTSLPAEATPAARGSKPASRYVKALSSRQRGFKAAPGGIVFESRMARSLAAQPRADQRTGRIINTCDDAGRHRYPARSMHASCHRPGPGYESICFATHCKCWSN